MDRGDWERAYLHYLRREQYGLGSEEEAMCAYANLIAILWVLIGGYQPPPKS